MLITGSRLVGCPILSLHVGGRVATVTAVIIDPHTLQIIAFEVEGPLVGREAGEILPTRSVREFSPLGMIVDSIDEFVERDDIIKIKETLELDFELIGLKVVTKRGAKLGKVVSYSLDPSNWQIEQLSVQRPFFKALLDPELLISRSQILEVDDYKVTVRDAADKVKQKAASETLTSNFINPFRDPNFANEPSPAESNIAESKAAKPKAPKTNPAKSKAIKSDEG